MSESVSNNRKRFFLWIEDNMSTKIASDIRSSIGVLNILLQKNLVISTQLFDINDIDVVDEIIERIKNNRGIRIHSRRRRSVTVSALYAYKEYLGSKASNSDFFFDDADEDIQIVSFIEKLDYLHTRPVSIEYFGEAYDVENWTELYVQTVNCLQKRYPDEIQSLIGKSIGSRGRIDITNEKGADELIVPKKIGTGLYLETNYSASEIIIKIRQLMDICEVEYSNVVIRYVPKGISNKQTQPGHDYGRGNTANSSGDFYTWLIETERLATPVGKNYASGINNCDIFCREHNIGTGKIYGTESHDEIIQNIELLISDKEFQNYNDMQHHRFTAALEKYRKFLVMSEGVFSRQYLPKQRPEDQDDSVEVCMDERMRIKATLSIPRFEYGFKDDGVELYRFRASYVEVNGVDCNLDDGRLLTEIRRMGFEFDGKVYLIPNDKKQSIIQDVKRLESQGVNIIYYESLYDLNSDEYFGAKIVSAEMLKDILKSFMPKFRYKSSYFALTSERQTELELIRNDILRVWGNNVLRTLDELSMELPLIPIEKIRFGLTQQSAFVRNSSETYARVDMFEADEEEVNNLVSYIDEQCEGHGRVLLDEIPFDNLKIVNSEFSESAFFSCFCKLIEDRFDRNARILTRKGASKNIYTAVIEFCRKQERCTYDYLVHIAQRVTGTIKHPEIIRAANAVMVRIDKNDFVADRLIMFDVDNIDMALDHIVTDDFIGIREITTFSTFPFCGYAWNLFLLESYCRRFSKKYRYDTRRDNSSNSGAVIVKSCTLSYHEIMAHAVARSGRDLSKEEIFEYLTETGYMERKRYNDITLLINDAVELRERRD